MFANFCGIVATDLEICYRLLIAVVEKSGDGKICLGNTLANDRLISGEGCNNALHFHSANGKLQIALHRCGIFRVENDNLFFADSLSGILQIGGEQGRLQLLLRAVPIGYHCRNVFLGKLVTHKWLHV